MTRRGAEISDQVFAQIVELIDLVPLEVAAASTLAMLDGVARGYRVIAAGDTLNDEVTTELMGTLGIKRAQLVALITA